ncbi:MAG: transcription termination/antitermination protein NusG [Firmicutes bacterium]|nr:transcription termination/antitermination protein NusG [Bacillota bacterium]HOB35402.1 transcription termination/antitermination protein NusG [Bacillota bacterium]HPZ90960.1 transcription termination/antitermination protein NusG [Bacillota bacterium]HQE01962.1 transcription termination/antitermination protein NusG [Bacillota bacterium]
MTRENEVKWYVVHTYSGYENKVKANLEKRIAHMKMEDKIFRVRVPMEEERDPKAGKTVQKKVFPGYVLVEMIMTDESWYVVRNTPGVTGFVGSGSRPIPLSESELRNIMKRIDDAEPLIKVEFEVGDNIKITRGPFAGVVAVVQEIMPDKGKVKVSVSIFGRETPMELDFDQVEAL